VFKCVSFILFSPIFLKVCWTFDSSCFEGELSDGVSKISWNLRLSLRPLILIGRCYYPLFDEVTAGIRTI
jgi:hypothetical protein